MHERAQHRTAGVALDDGARLAQPHPPAAHLADRELVADEPVQLDAARDDVAAVLVGSSGGSNDSHTSASISVSALPGIPDGNVPVPGHVAVALEPAAGERADAVEQPRRLAGGGRDRDRLDRAALPVACRARRARERDVGRRDDEPVLDRVRLDLGAAGRDPRRRPTARRT